MPNDRVYRENIRIDVAYPEAFAAFATPTVAELNNATFVKNITCALDEDGTEFTLGDPDTDDSLSFCDSAGNQTATFQNPTVTLTAFRDEDRAATGVFDMALQHLAFPDAPLIAILRVGYDSDVAYATTQRLNMVGGKTDLPLSVEESGTNARLSNTILPDGTVNWGYVVAS
jgi:hypothetical protein